MKRSIRLLPLILLASCASWTPAQRGAFVGDITTIASVAAGLYGGPAAAAGLNALGSVLQAYVGRTIPPVIVQASPGIDSLGTDLKSVIVPGVPVTQGDANALFTAAKIALSK